MVLPVRLWITNLSGTQESHLAHTLDVSDHGARLSGFHGSLKVGQLLEIQYRHKRARFRVVWISNYPGSTEKQIGAECVEPDKRVWGVDFPEVMDQYKGTPNG